MQDGRSNYHTGQPFKQFSKGVRTGLPVAIGYMPIATAFGALAIKANLSPQETVLMSACVFAGASQFMAITMMLQSADGIQIVIATLFINLRHLVMSMAVHHVVQSPNRLWRALLSFGITDETFALLTLQKTRTKTDSSPFFAAGLIGIAYSSWVAGTAFGSLGSRIIPLSISAAMTIGLYAMFIGLVMPHVRRSVRVACITGISMTLNTVLAPMMDSGWAIVISTILGASFGLLWKETAM